MDHIGNMAESVELLYEKARKYAKTNTELIALNAVDKASDVVSSIAARVLVVLVIAMFALFISLGLSLLIGKLLNEYYLGFFIVSAFYLVLALVLYVFKGKLIKMPIANLVISKLLKSKKPDFNFFDNIKDSDHEAA